MRGGLLTRPTSSSVENVSGDKRVIRFRAHWRAVLSCGLPGSYTVVLNGLYLPIEQWQWGRRLWLLKRLQDFAGH